MIATIGRVQNGTNWYNVPGGKAALAVQTNVTPDIYFRVTFLYRQAAGGFDTESKKDVVFIFHGEYCRS